MLSERARARTARKVADRIVAHEHRQVMHGHQPVRLRVAIVGEVEEPCGRGRWGAGFGEGKHGRPAERRSGVWQAEGETRAEHGGASGVCAPGVWLGSRSTCRACAQ